MDLIKMDLRSIEYELDQKIESFQAFEKFFSSDPIAKESYQDVIRLLKTLYEEVLNLQNSLEISSAFEFKNMSSVIVLNNISPDFLFKVQLLSKKVSLPIHTVLNSLMNFVLATDLIRSTDINFDQAEYRNLLQNLIHKKFEITLANRDLVEVMSSDLKEIDIKYNFENIEMLIFKNISISEFSDVIGYIKGCKIIFVPSSIPKLLIYAKCKDIESIRIYERLEDVYDAVFIFT